MSDETDIPLSQPLPEGIELTEVADGERSEVMDRALTDQNDHMTNPQVTVEPQPFQVYEVPDHEPRSGFALRHDGTTESGVRIAKWLNEQDIPAFVVPAWGDFAAMIRISTFASNTLVTMEDYVVVTEKGKVAVFSASDARLKLRTIGDTTPFGRYTTNL